MTSFDTLEAAGGAFLLGEEHRIVLAGSIIHSHDQVESASPGTHSWSLPSWCNIMPGSGERSRRFLCVPRFADFKDQLGLLQTFLDPGIAFVRHPPVCTNYGSA